MNAPPSDADNSGEDSPRRSQAQPSATSDDSPRECPPTVQSLEQQPFALLTQPSTSANTVPTVTMTASSPMQALLDAAAVQRRLQSLNAVTVPNTTPSNVMSDPSVTALLEQMMAHQHQQQQQQHHPEQLVTAAALQNPFGQQHQHAASSTGAPTTPLDGLTSSVVRDIQSQQQIASLISLLNAASTNPPVLASPQPPLGGMNPLQAEFAKLLALQNQPRQMPMDLTAVTTPAQMSQADSLAMSLALMHERSLQQQQQQHHQQQQQHAPPASVPVTTLYNMFSPDVLQQLKYQHAQTAAQTNTTDVLTAFLSQQAMALQQHQQHRHENLFNMHMPPPQQSPARGRGTLSSLSYNAALPMQLSPVQQSPQRNRQRSTSPVPPRSRSPIMNSNDADENPLRPHRDGRSESLFARPPVMPHDVQPLLRAPVVQHDVQPLVRQPVVPLDNQRHTSDPNLYVAVTAARQHQVREPTSNDSCGAITTYLMRFNKVRSSYSLQFCETLGSLGYLCRFSLPTRSSAARPSRASSRS